MQRFGLTLLFWIMLVPFAAAQTFVPDSRFVVTRDVDFYGSDLAALFDTNFNACQRACDTNTLCQAFTFNTRSDACFPKTMHQSGVCRLPE